MLSIKYVLFIKFEILFELILLHATGNSNTCIRQHKAVDKSRLQFLELSEIHLSKCKQITNMLISTYGQRFRSFDGSCKLTLFMKLGI